MEKEKNPKARETITELKPEDMEKVTGGGDLTPCIKREEKDRYR